MNTIKQRVVQVRQLLQNGAQVWEALNQLDLAISDWDDQLNDLKNACYDQGYEDGYKNGIGQ